MFTTNARLQAHIPPPASKRHPLADAQPTDKYYIQATTTRDKRLPEAPAAPAHRDPPVPGKAVKVPPPTPPKVIVDRYNGGRYRRVGFLGEGGFARVWEVADDNNTRLACKVVAKDSLKTKKAKTKLYAEIKIHKSLQHPNIVGFTDCFEDEANVYMTLELCTNGSLMDMLRARRRVSEPETRVFLIQLIGACHYMHNHQVIHRDLKLGNLFLDSDMNVKVGDFGLAALIESPGERKKTICGTPNYIAPEVLFDQESGHSFEVDIWSTGVILYTLLIGRPPFQTKDVKAIYERIRDNNYEFPTERPISTDARQLIQSFLTKDPKERPSLENVLASPFFTRGIVPAAVPQLARESEPDFSALTKPISRANLARLRRAALLDDIPMPDSQYSAPANTQDSVATSQSRAQAEREFQKAIQPGSPISALLSSARQPLQVAPMGSQREEPLLRRLQAARADPKSPLGKRPYNAQHALEDAEHEDEKAERERERAQMSQKARIVAQMAPAAAGAREDDENVPPAVDRRPVAKEPRLARAPTKHERTDSAASQASNMHTVHAPKAQLSGFEGARETLLSAFDAHQRGVAWRAGGGPVEHERVFIVSWVDYCNKYGMAYALTDGSVGVHFNDSTHLVLAPCKTHFDFVETKVQGAQFKRKNYMNNTFPSELKNKVYLLKHFEKYIMEKLWGSYDFTFEDLERTRGMDFVSMYLRMRNVIIFRLSNGALQFNFYDHSKVILGSNGRGITYLDKNNQVTLTTLEAIFAHARANDLPREEHKFVVRLIEKLRYAKELLQSIHNADARREHEGEEAPTKQAEMEAAYEQALHARQDRERERERDRDVRMRDVREERENRGPRQAFDGQPIGHGYERDTLAAKDRPRVVSGTGLVAASRERVASGSGIPTGSTRARMQARVPSGLR
ncbi:Pkinase-domain-containing protein [Peniophora sp. CONT]|nr:Pkinase-domain-containing protein [Peniophora sp. CONT]